MLTAWHFEFSIECAVPRGFAWNFWTDVRNWALDADVESIALEGQFAAGTQGHTVSHSSGRIDWRIADVQPLSRAVLEFPAPVQSARLHGPSMIRRRVQKSRSKRVSQVLRLRSTPRASGQSRTRDSGRNALAVSGDGGRAVLTYRKFLHSEKGHPLRWPLSSELIRLILKPAQPRRSARGCRGR